MHRILGCPPTQQTTRSPTLISIVMLPRSCPNFFHPLHVHLPARPASNSPALPDPCPPAHLILGRPLVVGRLLRVRELAPPCCDDLGYLGKGGASAVLNMTAQ